MNKTSPVYSESTRCQDCYCCVRECPVKAIQVVDACAVILPERCVSCGTCVEACTSGAKKVRDDRPLAEALLASGRPVAVSLAPSWVAAFPGLRFGQMAAALRHLGFAGASETALGAQEVSARLAQDLDRSQGRYFLSTACPVAVELVCKYLPHLAEHLTPVASPLQAHARMLKEALGPQAAVAFFGPCVGKKLEAAPELDAADVVLSFDDLAAWLQASGVDPAREADAPPLLEAAAEGAWFPVEGGMAETIQRSLRSDHTDFVTLSGLAHVQEGLTRLKAPEPTGRNLFLELLACTGGCVGGPFSRTDSAVQARLEVVHGVREVPEACPRSPRLDVARAFRPRPVEEPLVTPGALAGALAKLGKYGPEDELNCRACGYDSCRDLARAILVGRGEPQMCVSHMRLLATRKANALLRSLPFGVVIVGADLEIIDCNHHFARMMGEDALFLLETQRDLSGAHLEKFIDFADRFRAVLEGGDEIIRETLLCRNRRFSVSVFPVEPGQVVGALLLDVTERERRRDEVIHKAQEVIQNMMENVQGIAFSLGSNAARSEGILNSIIAEFSAPERSEDGHGL